MNTELESQSISELVKTRTKIVLELESPSRESQRRIDEITNLASKICETPISLVTLLDDSQQWFKSSIGIGISHTPISQSFCAHAIKSPHEIFVVTDTSTDSRFFDNPLVVGEPNIAAYAGAPLVSSEGVPLGTLCVIDQTSRGFTPLQLEALRVLSKQVVSQFELSRKVKSLQQTTRNLSQLNSQLDQFAYIISHDLKAPIRHQSAFAAVILEDFEGELPDGVEEYLKMIQQAGGKADDIISDLSTYLHTIQTAFGDRDIVEVKELLAEVKELTDAPVHVAIKSSTDTTKILSNRTALRHILLNLMTNAVKYNDKAEGFIDIQVISNEFGIKISVTDNGPGIDESEHERIFEIFGRGSSSANTQGRGLGLAISAKLANNLGGELSYEPSETEGACFVLALPQ